MMGPWQAAMQGMGGGGGQPQGGPTGLSPQDEELLSELMGLGTLGERGKLLEHQMAQAEALRQPVGGGHTTGLGAALGGLGDVFRGVGAGVGGMQGAQGMEALMGKKDVGRTKFAKGVGGQDLAALLRGMGGGFGF